MGFPGFRKGYSTRVAVSNYHENGFYPSHNHFLDFLPAISEVFVN